MKRVFAVSGLLALALAGGAMAQELDAAIEMCNGCHGDNGVSQWSDVPTIAGIDAFTHSNAMYEFQDEARPCVQSEFRQNLTDEPATTMCAIAGELDDEQIEALAEHYAALPFVPADQEVDAALAEKGKAVHEKLCARCHTAGGSDPDDEASILAGQQMEYLQRTFDEYASGAREQPEPMKEKMDELSEDDVTALIHFYASQQ